MLNQPTLDTLRSMKLTGLADAYAQQSGKNLSREPSSKTAPATGSPTPERLRRRY